MRLKMLIRTPQTPTEVQNMDGETFLIGGLSDYGIRVLGASMTKAMLATARRQRKEHKKGSKP